MQVICKWCASDVQVMCKWCSSDIQVHRRVSQQGIIKPYKNKLQEDRKEEEEEVEEDEEVEDEDEEEEDESIVSCTPTFFGLTAP